MTEAIKSNGFYELSNNEMYTVGGGGPIDEVVKDLWKAIPPDIKPVIVPVVVAYLLYEGGKYLGRELAKAVYFD
jgi:hypothetical protein